MPVQETCHDTGVFVLHTSAAGRISSLKLQDENCASFSRFFPHATKRHRSRKKSHGTEDRPRNRRRARGTVGSVPGQKTGQGTEDGSGDRRRARGQKTARGQKPGHGTEDGPGDRRRARGQKTGHGTEDGPRDRRQATGQKTGQGNRRERPG
ncbi:hypothetical protein Bbelb_340030 [Branchiostoma belcheri]|nr:hypothetical protein Bbelb_340030 [Branchiostoma belcheri]